MKWKTLMGASLGKFVKVIGFKGYLNSSPFLFTSLCASLICMPEPFSPLGENGYPHFIGIVFY
jgi:hypothetical protein